MFNSRAKGLTKNDHCTESHAVKVQSLIVYFNFGHKVRTAHSVNRCICQRFMDTS